jgi:hypothetical protein
MQKQTQKQKQTQGSQMQKQKQKSNQVHLLSKSGYQLEPDTVPTKLEEGLSKVVLTCSDCATKFTWSVEEQKVFLRHRFDPPPRCKACRREKKNVELSGQMLVIPVEAVDELTKKNEARLQKEEKKKKISTETLKVEVVGNSKKKLIIVPRDYHVLLAEGAKKLQMKTNKTIIIKKKGVEVTSASMTWLEDGCCLEFVYQK